MNHLSEFIVNKLLMMTTPKSIFNIYVPRSVDDKNIENIEGKEDNVMS